MRLINFVNRTRGLAVRVDDIPCRTGVYKMIHVTIGEETVLKVDVIEATRLMTALEKAIHLPDKDG